MRKMQINKKYLSCLLLWLLLVAVAMPATAKRKKKTRPVAVVLSPEDCRRFDYFFLEAEMQALKGNYAEAFDLLDYCRQLNPSAAEPYFFLANYYNAMENDSVALTYLEQAVALRPDNQTYLEALAEAYYEAHQLDKAANVYESLAAKNRSRSDLLRILFGIYKSQKQYHRMIDCLNRIEQIEGSGEDITLSKVGVYSLMNDRKAALSALRQLVADHPYDLNYQVMMGNWLMQNGGKAEALKIFNDAHSKEPTNANVQASLYDYYKTNGHDSLAIAMMQTILLNRKATPKTRQMLLKDYIQMVDEQRGDSTRVVAMFDKVEQAGLADVDMAELKLAYLNLKKFSDDDKAAARTMLLRLAPDNVSARFDQLGWLWDQQRWDDVINLCREGIDYNPDQLGFYYYQGLAYYQEERNDEVLDVLRRGLAYIDKDTQKKVTADFYSLIGSVLYDQKDYEGAFEAFENCLKYDPDNVECMNNYAYFLSEHNRSLDKAAQLSARTIREEPKNATFLDTYAWILYKQQRFAEAKIYIDQALANDSDSVQSAVVLEHAGDIYYRNNQPDQAVDFWKKALEADSENVLLPKKIKLKKIIEDGDKKTK